MGDILRKARADGANIASDEAFDTAVEMTYRRDPTGTFDVPDRITYSDVQSNQTFNVMGTDEPLNQQARKAIKEAAKKFEEEQKVYDALAIDSGQFGYDTLTEIRKSAFRGCSGLTELRLPGSIRSLWHDAFSGCISLRLVAMHSAIQFESIWGGYSRQFKGCTSLTAVSAPAEVAVFY